MLETHNCTISFINTAAISLAEKGWRRRIKWAEKLIKTLERGERKCLDFSHFRFRGSHHLHLEEQPERYPQRWVWRHVPPFEGPIGRLADHRSVVTGMSITHSHTPLLLPTLLPHAHWVSVPFPPLFLRCLLWQLSGEFPPQVLACYTVSTSCLSLSLLVGVAVG